MSLRSFRPAAAALTLAAALASAAARADPPPVARSAVETRAARMFDQADTDHDGVLTHAEYRAAILRIAHRFDATPTDRGFAAADAQFFAIDRAHTGRIPRAQFMAAALGRFDSADLNHDGRVTPDEARKAEALRRKADRARGAGR